MLKYTESGLKISFVIEFLASFQWEQEKSGLYVPYNQWDSSMASKRSTSNQVNYINFSPPGFGY